MPSRKFNRNSQTQLVVDESPVGGCVNMDLISLPEKQIGSARKLNSSDSYMEEQSANEQANSSSDESCPVSRRELSVWKKVCFAMAGLTYQMYFCAISVYAVVFLLNSAKLPPSKNT